jgi:hypothetical protein
MRAPDVVSAAEVNWLPLGGTVITTLKEEKAVLGGSGPTIATLYGNDIAAGEARRGQPYGVGAELTLVRWDQREDPHWFGGRIPGKLASVETLIYRVKGSPDYQLFRASDLNTPIEPEAGFVVERIGEISRLKAAVLPAVH